MDQQPELGGLLLHLTIEAPSRHRKCNGTEATAEIESSSAPASVGTPLPEFSAIDANDAPFRSADLRGRPVLIKFFRGHW